MPRYIRKTLSPQEEDALVASWGDNILEISGDSAYYAYNKKTGEMLYSPENYLLPSYAYLLTMPETPKSKRYLVIVSGLTPFFVDSPDLASVHGIAKNKYPQPEWKKMFAGSDIRKIDVYEWPLVQLP